MATTIFINEIHYDNDGADAGEAVEIAAPAGTDLAGWTLVFYNGANSEVYQTTNLTGIVPDQDNGFGTLSFALPGIQNGSPDGIALVDDGGTVVQFLSYEGSFTAVGGPADGLTSTDIGVTETSSTPEGFSLQLAGIGTIAEDFTWQAASDDNFGDVNTGQVFSDLSSGTRLAIDDVAMSEGDVGDQPVFSFTVTRSGDLTGTTSVDWELQDVSTDEADFVLPRTMTGTVSFVAGQETATIEIQVQGDVDRESSEIFNIALTNPTNGATLTDDLGEGRIANDELTSIAEIQGAGHVSPFVTLDLANLPDGAFTVLGEEVATTGIVTAVDNNGFYLQDPAGDGDDATSEAIFVSTGSAPTVIVGDGVTVSGLVAEVFPGGTGSRNLPTTQIVSPSVEITSSGNDLPEAVIIGAGGRQVPTDEIDDDGFASFDPADDGIDFFESLEGMRVTATDLVAVSPTSRFGEIFAVADNGDGATGLSDRGSLNISPDDFNPEKIQIDTDFTVSGFNVPQVDAGAVLGDVTGVVGYSFGNFEIIPTEPFTVETPSTLDPEVTALTGSDNQLSVASYNVLNLDPNDDDGDTDVADGRFDAIAQDIVSNLGSPDIIALQEVQDNDGSANSDITAADETLQALIDAIDRTDDGDVNGSLQYEFIDNAFIGNDTSGGQPGANIRTAFLYNPERVTLVDGSVQSIQDSDQQTNEDNPFFDTRLPLVATFAFNGEEVTVVNNHFSSKGGSAPILGTEQPFEDGQEDPNINGSLDERQAQADAVNGFVQDKLADDPFANIVVTGDFNEFEFVSPIQTLEGSLTNLVSSEITAGERYSFNFQGNSQQLDHLLISDALQFDAAFDIVHVNTEFTDAASDHDPLVAALTVESMNEIAGTQDRDFLFGSGEDDMILAMDGKDTVLAGRGNDKIGGGGGKDVILAGDGDDQVLGGDGKDKIFGNRGNDLIDGGADDDKLFGGLDDDMFVFNFAPDEGFGDDTIYDFGLGEDKIVLKNASDEDIATVEEAIADAGFGKTVIDFGDSGSITVFGFGLTSDDFIFV